MDISFQKNAQIMGILNLTPDSFSDGGKYQNKDKAIDRVAQMIKEGANIIDVGGESTRPGAAIVTIEQELERVAPIVQAIHNRFDIPISVDTSQPEVIFQSVLAGATIWNDTRALTISNAAKMAVKLDIPIILMHHRGTPQTMSNLTEYDSVIDEVLNETLLLVEKAISQGVSSEKILIDPGFGFAKNTHQNVQLLKALEQWKKLPYPLVVGVSRKKMFSDILNEPDPAARAIGSTMAAMVAVQKGANIIRTHDVKMVSDALKVLAAVS